MERAQSAGVMGGDVMVTYHSTIRGRRPPFSVVFNDHAHRVGGYLRIELGVDCFGVHITGETFQYVQNLFPACLLDAWMVKRICETEQQ